MDFAQSNKVKVIGAFEGDTLVYSEPDPQVIYMPEEAMPPPWVDPTVNYIDEKMTYVDGEWLNLDLIEIDGDSSVKDIDLDEDGLLPKHEILVYFARLSQAQNKEIDFELNYSLQSSYFVSTRAVSEK